MHSALTAQAARAKGSGSLRPKGKIVNLRRPRVTIVTIAGSQGTLRKAAPIGRDLGRSVVPTLYFCAIPMHAVSGWLKNK